MGSREACAKTKTALEQARNIQGESAEALYVDGFEAFVERDWRRWDDSYRRANKLDPNNSRALGTFGVINCVVGRADEGIRILKSARDADPLAAYTYAMSATGLVAANRLEESMSFFEQAFAFEPDHPLALWAYSVACGGLKKFEESIQAAQRAVEVTNRVGFYVGLLGWSLATAGKTEEAKSALEEIRRGPLAMLPWEACILGVLGEPDAACDAFSRAVDDLAPFACYVSLPCFDGIRNDPRFPGLVDRLQFPAV
jgi:tetratricopeptide (TPR) repeat protein